MSTFMPKANEIERKWYIIDAAGKPLGRTAAKVAVLLRGKHKPIFTPHVDCGDHVIVINCKDAVLTGNKLQDKRYYHHSGWIGGLKERKYSDIMKTKPQFAMQMAVKRMVPDTVIGRKALLRLRLFKDANHIHAAQKPEIYEF
jgi:ribosomal protein L13, bacterial type